MTERNGGFRDETVTKKMSLEDAGIFPVCAVTAINRAVRNRVGERRPDPPPQPPPKPPNLNQGHDKDGGISPPADKGEKMMAPKAQH